MILEEFENALVAYDFRFQQDVVQYLETLKQTGYTLVDVYSYIETKRSLLQESLIESTRTIQNCPECPALMFLLPVNDKPETQTGDDSKSVWLCQNKKCMYTIYNKKTVEEISKKE